MEYFNNILCITQPELLEVMSESNYKQMVRRGKINRARRGGNGRQALIVFDSLPGKYRSAVRERKPDISTMPLQEWLRANYTPDAEARSYFSAFRFDNGSALPAEKINEYTVNASVIKAVLRLMASANACDVSAVSDGTQWPKPLPISFGKTATRCPKACSVFA